MADNTEPESSKDALVFCIYDGTSPQGRLIDQRYWKPGQSSPYNRIIGLHGELVMVKAHGLAYQWVRENFPNIRLRNRESGATWVGEDAVFIINNLKD